MLNTSLTRLINNHDLNSCDLNNDDLNSHDSIYSADYRALFASDSAVPVTDRVNNASVDESTAAFGSLPPIIQNALMQQQRLVVVANNPSIQTENLDEWLQPTDILVLFNDFIHADYFTHHPIARQLPKLLFFRQNGDSLLHFGMPPRSNNVSAINDMAKQAPLGLLFSNQPYQFPTPHDDPNPSDDPVTASRTLTIPKSLKNLLNSDDHCRVLSEWHPVVKGYPCFIDIHSSAPTSGFLLYKLLLAARQHVQQRQPDALPLKILMLGFNDDTKTNHFWQGHNWQFERQEMKNAPYGVDIIRQY